MPGVARATRLPSPSRPGLCRLPKTGIGGQVAGRDFGLRLRFQHIGLTGRPTVRRTCAPDRSDESCIALRLGISTT
ncbi:MAG: hypothetical protein KAT27_08665, partial [Desulfobacterales bacterium]|nr:hypothetical protein [Desulfobacterales bacterium]